MPNVPGFRLQWLDCRRRSRGAFTERRQITQVTDIDGKIGDIVEKILISGVYSLKTDLKEALVLISIDYVEAEEFKEFIFRRKNIDRCTVCAGPDSRCKNKENDYSNGYAIYVSPNFLSLRYNVRSPIPSRCAAFLRLPPDSSSARTMRSCSMRSIDMSSSVDA